MNDKTLLELAAKAAGINVVGDIEKYLVFPERRAGGFIIETATGGHTGWNPLTDDGDALRLAVKLSIHVLQYGTVTTAKHVGSTTCFDERGDGQSDKTQETATRRAIVRCAAEIGKAA